METVLIFGATGGIGAYTALHLKEKKYNVIAVGNRKSDNGFFQQYDIEYYSVDISNFDSLCVVYTCCTGTEAVPTRFTGR